MKNILESYKELNPIIYKIIYNSFMLNKFSHAYLINSNNIEYGYNFAKELSKIILGDNIVNDDVSKLIDNEEYPDIVIINPIGLTIKKDQINYLKSKMSTSSLISNKKIYIINNCQCLNDYSSNALLKFLEEPENGIYAILITNDINKIKDTIKSRCQTLNIVANINNSNDIDTKVIDFVKDYEQNGLDEILYINKMWFDNFDSKEKTNIAFQKIISIYKNALNIKLNYKKLDTDNYNDLVEIAKSNTIDKLIKKIKLFSIAQEKNLINCNMRLVMDKLIMDLEG